MTNWLKRVAPIGLLITALAGLLTFAIVVDVSNWKWSDQKNDQFGYVPHPEEAEQFIATMPRPMLSQAAPHLIEQRQAKEPVFLYRSLYRVYKAKTGKDWRVKAQGIGDCVSWAWAHAADIHLAILFELGETSDWAEASTEALYGGGRVEALGRTRAGYSDGSYGAAQAKWCKNYGVVFRKSYPELGYDLSSYSSSRAKDWGNFGCGGRDDNGRLDTIAKGHPIRDVALVTTFEEAAAAIESGYPVAVCSGIGFDPMYGNVRDKDGFARQRGGWSHAMVFIGVRYDRPGLLCLNSWGPTWISGAKYPDDQPDGSFWVDQAVANSMLKQRDSYAVSGMLGFPHNDLHHGDWASLPRRRGLVHSLAHYSLAP